jgi:hypothetical protein
MNHPADLTLSPERGRPVRSAVTCKVADGERRICALMGGASLRPVVSSGCVRPHREDHVGDDGGVF